MISCADTYRRWEGWRKPLVELPNSQRRALGSWANLPVQVGSRPSQEAGSQGQDQGQ